MILQNVKLNVFLQQIEHHKYKNYLKILKNLIIVNYI